MKKALFFIFYFTPLMLLSQQTISWSDDFSDGDFTHNPTWSGTADNFIINKDKQLQSNAPGASRSYLSTSSEVFENGVWEFWVRINYNPTSQNYSMVYIISDRVDVSGEVNGYYVQIGNTAKEISLYRQEGSKRTKIIDGEDRILDMNPVIVKIRVTRSNEGDFALYRQRFAANGDAIDDDYVQEGTTVNDLAISNGSKYFGLLFNNSGATGKNYFFDDIVVSGEKFKDTVPPVWTGFSIQLPNQLLLTFSEAIDISSANFTLNHEMGQPESVSLSGDKTRLILSYSKNFESGKVYVLSVENIKDLAGNLMEEGSKEIALLENPTEGDLVINEILFDVSADNAEFIEVYNRSDKILDMSRVFFGVRGTVPFRPNNFFPEGTLLMPDSYLAITASEDLLRTYYMSDESSKTVEAERWSALNNNSAHLLIGTFVDNDTIYLDEVEYNAKWHHALVKNPRNVSLEKIHPDLPSNSPESWHSAASEAGYATPGKENSQYREIDAFIGPKERWVWTDPEVFSPDNDGIDDVCFIHYKTDDTGYMANVIVFNSVGQRVKQLASNMLLASEGMLTWDGKTDSGKNVNPGIYVLYFEMIQVDKGVKKLEKLPLVVSAR